MAPPLSPSGRGPVESRRAHYAGERDVDTVIVSGIYVSLLITDNMIQRQVRGLWVGVEVMELAELGADKFGMGYGISDDY